jgi:hypothetical protein
VYTAEMVKQLETGKKLKIKAFLPSGFWLLAWSLLALENSF